MPRQRNPSVTLDALLRRGAIELYNRERTRAGYGRRGEAAAERLLRSRFPGVTQSTIDAISRRADASRKTEDRFRKGNQSYRLPEDQHPELPCDRTTTGSRRKRVYVYQVEVTTDVHNQQGVLFTHTHHFTIDFSKPPSKLELQEFAARAGYAEAKLFLAGSWRNAGGDAIGVRSIKITGAYTCLT